MKMFTEVFYFCKSRGFLKIMIKITKFFSKHCSLFKRLFFAALKFIFRCLRSIQTIHDRSTMLALLFNFETTSNRFVWKRLMALNINESSLSQTSTSNLQLMFSPFKSYVTKCNTDTYNIKDKSWWINLLSL